MGREGLRSDHSFHVVADCVQEQGLHYFVVESWVVLAGPLAIWGECYLQKFGLHVLGINHHINPVYGPALLRMHAWELDSSCHEGIPQHLLDLFVHLGPLDGGVVSLEFLDEVNVFDLFEVADCSVVHDGELGLVGA